MGISPYDVLLRCELRSRHLSCTGGQLLVRVLRNSALSRFSGTDVKAAGSTVVNCLRSGEDQLSPDERCHLDVIRRDALCECRSSEEAGDKAGTTAVPASCTTLHYTGEETDVADRTSH